MGGFTTRYSVYFLHKCAILAPLSRHISRFWRTCFTHRNCIPSLCQCLWGALWSQEWRVKNQAINYESINSTFKGPRERGIPTKSVGAFRCVFFCTCVPCWTNWSTLVWPKWPLEHRSVKFLWPRGTLPCVPCHFSLASAIAPAFRWGDSWSLDHRARQENILQQLKSIVQT